MELRKLHGAQCNFASRNVQTRISATMFVAASILFCAAVEARELSFITDTKLSKFESNCKGMGGQWSSGSTSGGGKRGTCETETTVLSCSYEQGSTAGYCSGETSQPPSTPAKMVRPRTVKKHGGDKLWSGGKGSGGMGGTGGGVKSGGGGSAAAGGNGLGSATFNGNGNATGNGCSGGVC